MRKRESHIRDRNRALFAGAVLVLVCAGSLLVANQSVRTSDQLPHRAALNERIAGKAAMGGQSGTGTQEDDDALTTGSILFVPDAGNVCRQRLIDNRTWIMRDNGFVTCDEAVSWNSGLGRHGPFSGATRVDAIRDGFFPRQ